MYENFYRNEGFERLSGAIHYTYAWKYEQKTKDEIEEKKPDAFFKTTVIPVFLMFVVNLIVIIRMMQYTPLQFLRCDLKKTKRKKTIRLPKWSFFSRFRMRIIFQNTLNYIILFAGVFFIMVMLA
ncbi:MAG: hypothetical protein SPF19_15765 [Oliverpabstia sp.]|nr:hypothetical protein [Lachnospiraceae bacterium]MDY5027951.1 hypothetical protein [Oliverpabstia sp.]